MARPSLFRATSIFADSNRKEIDLRERMDDILYATKGGIPHGHPVILRTMRRSGGEKVECTCRTERIVIEPSYSCPYCLGEGFLWDESWAIAYSMQSSSESGFVRKYQHVAPGDVRVDYTIFFLDYRQDIAYGDKIIEVLLDKEGQPVIPYIRSAIYRPETIVSFRSDYGRVEYIAVYCREKDAIREENDAE